LALGPHEVLVLANENSVASLAVAKEFVRMRGVPSQNLVRLRLPVPRAGAAAEITPDEFTQRVWQPANLIAQQRGLSDHVLAWVYSVDFPVAVSTRPAISTLGLTFLRNKLPDSQQVEGGRYASPLFAGPSAPLGAAHYPQSFNLLAESLGDGMPLPGMMLGWTGERGISADAVVACLERGVRSDGSAPSGTVYFVTGDDVRSTCRQWQYPQAAAELMQLGVRASISSRFPTGRNDIVGLMIGLADVNPAQGAYRPGAMAEHLTSAAAVFNQGSQTKLTAWISAGATASAGTVTEPYSKWTKFPHARFFAHYAAGCTMIESFYQSIRCPLQILLVGDPLAQPWAARPRVFMSGVDAAEVSGTLRVAADMAADADGHWARFVYLLDGRVIHRGRKLDLDTLALGEGEHTLRAVAYRTGMVQTQSFVEKEFRVVRVRGAAPANADAGAGLSSTQQAAR